MLTEFLENLRQKEIKETDELKHKDVGKLKYSEDIRMNTRIPRYIRDNFDIHEYTTHFYDDYKLPFEKRMQFNNWVDAFGPGLWYDTVEEADYFAFNCMLTAAKRKEYFYANVKLRSTYTNEGRWHIFIFEKAIMLYWFGRDLNHYESHDCWWIYNPKDKEKPINIGYFYKYCYKGDER